MFQILLQVLVEDDDEVGLRVSYPFSAGSGTPTARGSNWAEGSSGLVAGTVAESDPSVKAFVFPGYGVSLRSKPFGTVSVAVSVAHSDHAWLNANASKAFSLSTSNLVFTTTNWNVRQRVGVFVYSDEVARPDPNFVLTFTHDVSSSNDPAYDRSEISDEPSMALTVTEDDEAGIFTSASRLMLGVDYSGRPMFTDEYALSLRSQPTHRVAVRLTAVNESLREGTATDTHLSQRDFVFTKEDWNVERLIYVNATSSLTDLSNRNEKILHTITSLDPMYRGPASEPASGVGAANGGLGPHVTVSVIVSRDGEPPPKIRSSEFLPSGGGALIVFDRQTNKAGLQGSFHCERLLYGPAVEGFGVRGRCSWPSPMILKVTLASDAAVKPGEYFYIRNKMLQNSAVGTTLFVTNATGRLDAPAAAVAPKVTLNAPDVIGRCDDLLVDARLTSGSGGRSLMVNWNVTFSDFKNQRDVVDDLEHTNATVANISLAVWEATRANALFVSAPNLFPGFNNPMLPFATMRFTVVARNWLGLEDEASVEVKKASLDAPVVQIAGYGSTATVYAADDLKLSAKASMPACGGGNTPLRYIWAEPSGFLSASELSSVVTAQPRAIKVKAGTMKAGLTYVFEVSAFLPGYQEVNGTSRISITAKASDLFSAIAGGSSRMQSRLDDIELDASSSYDPDTASTGHLTYRWSCIEADCSGCANTTCTSSCHDFTAKSSCVNGSGWPLTLPTASNLSYGVTIPARSLTAGYFRFGLTTFAPSDGRNASASVDMTLAATKVPIVSIAALRQKKVNPTVGSYLELVGSIVGDPLDFGTLNYLWTKASGDDASEPYTTVFATAANRIRSVLELGALTAGTTYAFRLTAFAIPDDDTAETVSAYAEVSVEVNSPPTSGTFVVGPSVGVALSTTFLLTCESWVDDAEDLPLKYSFKSAPGMEAALVSDAVASEALLVSASTTPSFSTLLPEGDANSGNVSLVAYISDRFSGTSRITTVAGVGSLSDSFANLFGRRRLEESSVTDEFGNYLVNLSSSLSGDALLTGDSEKMAADAASVASVANSPGGAAAMSSTKTQELVGGLVSNMAVAASSMDTTAESLDLVMGSLGTVANGQPERLDDSAQASMFGLSLALLAGANTEGARLSISDAAGAAACTALATLVSSDTLFGPSNINSTNNSAALSGGLNQLASGRLVDRFAGMAATETACPGLLVSAAKINAADADGAAVAAGNSTFTMPGNFSKMANISEGDVVETSAQVRLCFHVA